MTPTEIQYAIGDATEPLMHGPGILAHVCNDLGVWGRGFTAAIDARWPSARSWYITWNNAPNSGLTTPTLRVLGTVQFISLPNGVILANMIAQHGVRGNKNPIPLDMRALHTCLTTVANASRALRLPVHMPRIGCGLAGGHWEGPGGVREAVEQTFVGALPPTIYDLPAP